MNKKEITELTNANYRHINFILDLFKTNYFNEMEAEQQKIYIDQIEAETRHILICILAKFKIIHNKPYYIRNAFNGELIHPETYLMECIFETQKQYKEWNEAIENGTAYDLKKNKPITKNPIKQVNTQEVFKFIQDIGASYLFIKHPAETPLFEYE